MISKKQFISYEEVRKSGVTNMFNVKLVCELSGLEQEQAMEIMKNYKGLKEKYLKQYLPPKPET